MLMLCTDLALSRFPVSLGTVWGFFPPCISNWPGAFLVFYIEIAALGLVLFNEDSLEPRGEEMLID